MNSILGVPACRRSGYSPFRCRSIPTGRASHAATIPNAGSGTAKRGKNSQGEFLASLARSHAKGALRNCHTDSSHLTVSLKRNKSAVTLFDTVIWYNGKMSEINIQGNKNGKEL